MVLIFCPQRVDHRSLKNRGDQQVEDFLGLSKYRNRVIYTLRSKVINENILVLDYRQIELVVELDLTAGLSDSSKQVFFPDYFQRYICPEFA